MLDFAAISLAEGVMAARIVRHVPGTGSVSMAKVRQAVKAVKAKLVRRKPSAKKLVVTKDKTASGRKLIAFRGPMVSRNG